MATDAVPGIPVLHAAPAVDPGVSAEAADPLDVVDVDHAAAVGPWGVVRLVQPVGPLAYIRAKLWKEIRRSKRYARHFSKQDRNRRLFVSWVTGCAPRKGSEPTNQQGEPKYSILRP